MSDMPLDESAEFVALAATLLLIKSRSLLPQLQISEEESKDIKELEYRLAVYQIVRGGARGLEKVFGKTPMLEGTPLDPEPLFVPDNKITLETLAAAAERLITEFPVAKAELPTAAVRKIVSLEEMIEDLGSRITSALRLSFREYAGMGKKEKHDIIVTFLAMLELVKQGMIRAEQSEAFEDIMLEHDDIQRPSYE
jgi:segregation and condensation protein A